MESTDRGSAWPARVVSCLILGSALDQGVIEIAVFTEQSSSIAIMGIWSYQR